MRPVHRIALQAFPKEMSLVWPLPGIPSGHNLPDIPQNNGEAQRLPLLTKGGAPRSELEY